MDSDTFIGVAWGKWIALACLIAAVICVVVSVTFYNKRRLRDGEAPMRGTAWLLPNYIAAQSDRDGIPEVPAPAYNPNITEFDAGYYDKDGNFIARPVELTTLDPTQQPPDLSAVNSHASHGDFPPPSRARRSDSIV